jgi:hypothetical protein
MGGKQKRRKSEMLSRQNKIFYSDYTKKGAHHV